MVGGVDNEDITKGRGLSEEKEHLGSDGKYCEVGTSTWRSSKDGKIGE